MTIRPILNDDDHAAALARLEELWGAADGTSERDEFLVLSVLIDAYETEHHKIAPPDPIDAILFRMDQMGWTRKDLERAIGITRARVSEILAGKRALSVDLVRTIRDAMNISADILISSREPRRHAKRPRAHKKGALTKKARPRARTRERSRASVG